MERGNTVPTAIAFIAFVAIIIVCFLMIKGNVNKDQTEAKEKEAAEVGELADMSIFIGGKTYTAKTESTKAAKSFLEHLPLTLEMKDKDSGSKSGMIYFKLTTAASSFKEVEAGDILIYGSSEIIIVYETHKVNGKYTKVGHIDNIEKIPSGEVGARISIVE